MKWLWLVWLAGFMLAGTVAWWSHTPAEVNPAAPQAAEGLRERGAYLARVGNCAGCHTARGGADYAGGRGLPTPFGMVYAGNLTPDPATGLGRWDADDFWRAMHHGRSRDGRLLNPAFPFTAFTHVTRSDSDALFAYLHSLPPVSQAAPPSGLRFPYNTQAALAVWRALYFRPAEAGALTKAGQPADWARGAYLVQGLGHCAACHAPRNGLGATVQAEAMGGGALPAQAWIAPSLAPRPGEPLPLQRAALVELLRTGLSAHGSASGPMAEVVSSSTQHWSERDLDAAATYLMGLPMQPTTTAEPGAIPADQQQRGRALYADRCARCHGEQGEGVAGVYPALAGNPTVTMVEPDNALQVLRHGGFAPSTASNPRPYGMPPSELSVEQMADVLSHVRQSWGNRAEGVTALQALRVR